MAKNFCPGGASSAPTGHILICARAQEKRDEMNRIRETAAVQTAPDVDDLIFQDELRYVSDR